MRQLIKFYKDYFHIPFEFRFLIADKDMKTMFKTAVLILIFSLTGCLFSVPGIEEPERKKIILIYYLAFAFVSVFFMGLTYFLHRTEKFYTLKRISVYLVFYATLFLIVYALKIPSSPFVNDVICIGIYSLLMIFLFNMNPVIETVSVAMVFILIIQKGFQTESYRADVYLNFILLLIVIICFSFYKRFVTIRDLTQKTIMQDQNHILNEQKEELLRQKVALLNHKEILENEIIAQTKDIEERNEKIIRIQKHTILGLSNLVENRDEDTGEHVLRTAAYVKFLATKAKENSYFSDFLDKRHIVMLEDAAPMHDIGKIVVPDAVLKKPGKLTDEEYEQMKRHAPEGGRIVREILGDVEDPEFVQIAEEIATYHHEKWNGKGYPKGLKGEEIPLSARIMAVADVFDALVSPRCYKEPMPVEEAFKSIKEDAGKHFDPVLAELFVKYSDGVVEIMNQFKN